MKSLHLCLIFLNIWTIPSLAIGEQLSVSTNIKINDRANHIYSLAAESEETVDREIKVNSDSETEENSESEPAETTNEDDSESEKQENSKSETTEQVKEATPEEIARLEKFATADRLYLAGDKAGAAKLYREVKEVWPIEQEKATEKDEETPQVFDNPAELSPAGKVFWRNYQQGKKQQLETKILSSLKLLTTKEPQFIPGHIHYAEMLKMYERPAESTKVLNRAVNRYPNEPKLLQAKIDADIADEKWLDASISARQFALFNPDSPEAEKFEQLADEYLAQYQSNLRSKLTWNAIGNAIAGTVGFALTGNLFGPISAIDTTATLLRGESAVGEATVKRAKKQLPLIESEEIVKYVEQIGQKVATASGRDEFDYEFYIVMDDRLNAFALPGGKVFVNAGAIMKTDSEAELAGLLAHEVAHAALSHGFQLVTQGNLTANVVSYIPYVGSTATSLIVLNYSRGMEKQADTFGTKILVNAGYAADGVRNLMVKLHESHADEDNPEPPAWLSTHPNSKQRVSYMENLIVENNLNRYAYEGVIRHQEIKKLVTAQWKEYEKCVEEVDDIEGAKECAGNKNQEEKLEENDSQNEEIEINESQKEQSS
ncbi:M48 family metallopeptidase [Pleurocapsa sp. PCC 7319]|uniref:M48 family metallopeptidase n=1 Tax=Pleurocapsa sp. PCC 7319 TaxID=118161 RepID=UPI00034506B3|nr:M48 family metallopeptidase [Pleurocapsa sp. PCC 7319]